MKSIQGQAIMAVAESLIQLGQSLKEIVLENETELTKVDYIKPVVSESEKREFQPTTSGAKDYLSVNDLKEYLQIGHKKAYQLAQRKDFPKVRLGNKYIFPKKAVDEWMEKEAARSANSKLGFSKK